MGGYRHGRRQRQLTTTLGAETVNVPRARLPDGSGHSSEWRSRVLGACQRRTRRVAALLTSVCPAGAHTRRVKKALFALFKGAVRKDVVSRAWCKVKGEWEAWRHRSLAAAAVIHLLLDGMVVRTRLDHKAHCHLPAGGLGRATGRPEAAPGRSAHGGGEHGPCAETVPMLFRALLAATQSRMGKVDGWAHLCHPIQPFTLDVAA